MALPKIYAGRRRRLLARLVGNGVLQAATAFGVAKLLHGALLGARGGDLRWPLLLGLAASGLVILALRTVEAADAERLGQDYVMRVRVRIFRNAARRPLVVDGHPRWGVTMTRLIGDLNSLRNWVSEGVARATVAAIVVAGLLGALASFHRGAAAAAAALVLLTGAAAAALTPALRSYVREARRRRGRLANNLGEKIFAFLTVRQFGNTERELDRVRSHSRQLRDAVVRRVRAARLLRSLPDAMLPVAIAMLVAVAASGGHAAADVTVGVLLLGMLATALRDLARAWNHRLAFDEGRRRIGQNLAGPWLREHPYAVDLPGRGPVTVRLEGAAVAGRLAPMSASAGAGDTVLVCGESGSGKSTLLALVARMLDPDEGGVEIDGIPADRLTLESIYASVQLVSPSLPLLRGSVAQNLGYGVDGVKPEWIDTVACACRLVERTPFLPQGVDSMVEEQGRNLPDGLRARIALARAAASAPRLLLVDDPVFLVDGSAKAALQRVLGILEATTLIVGADGHPPFRFDRVWQIGKPLRPAQARAGTGGAAPHSRATGPSFQADTGTPGPQSSLDEEPSSISALPSSKSVGDTLPESPRGKVVSVTKP